jgi:TolB-like protein
MVPAVQHDEQVKRPARPDVLALLKELRERHLFKIAAAYAVSSWVVIQVVDIVGPAFDLPAWVLRAIILAAIVGFLALMGFLLFRPRHDQSGRLAIYLSPRARLVAGAGSLLIAAAAAALTVRSLTTREQVTLAVLPFADMSPQRDKGFLAEGVAEEILSTLGKNSEIKVLGRTSSWALRERTGDLAAIRSSLGVTHLLEGSIRSAGQDLRLSVRLIRTADGSQEWAEDYRGRSADVFALQDTVAQAVAARLSDDRADATTPRTEITDADAYNLYLAARQIARTRTEPELKRAYALARRVVDGQPDFAPGHALLAELTRMLSDGPNSYGSIPAAKARRIAAVHARKAIELAPGSAEGHAALGLALTGEQAIAALRRAMALDPARAEIPLWLALELDNADRFKDALVYLERAAAIDPLWPAAVSRLAVDLNAAGHFDRAKHVIDQFEARGGDRAQVARFRATMASLSGDLSELVRWGLHGLKLNQALPYVPSYVQRGLALMRIPAPVPLATSEHAIRDRFYSQALDAAVSAEPLSEELWQESHLEYFVYAAGAKRDWPRLAAFFDLHKDALEEICFRATYMAGTFAMALRETGRGDEAAKLVACGKAQAAKIQYGGPRRISAIAEAEIAALAGNADGALNLLDHALRYGWTGKTAKLTDIPALDSLAASPRYAAIQRGLNEWIARERRETVALLAPEGAT